MGVGYNPKIVTDGLVLFLDAANPKSYNYNMATYSQDFQNAVYTKTAGLITATGVLAPDGTSTATTMTDDDAGVYDNFNRTFTIPNDSSTYNISLYIRKTTGGTSPRTGFNINLTGGSLVNSFPRFNTDTGVLVGSNNMSVTSENNNYWRVSFTVTNNSSGNTTLSISYFPATGPYNGSDVSTATGSHTVWGFQVTKGAALLPYRINVNTSDTTWYDLSGKNYHGLLNNTSAAPIYSSAFSGTFDFSNSAKFYIDIPELNNTNSYSVIWFGADGAGDAYGGVSRDTAWQVGNHLIGWQTGAINTDSGRDTNTNVAGSEFMICHTHDTIAKNVDQYLNGNYYGSFTYTTWAARERWSIGARNATDHQYTGKIAAVQIYNRLLSAAEIQQNFNAARGRFGI